MLDAEKGFLLRNAGALAPLFWWMRLPFGRYGLGSVQTLRTKKLFKHIALPKTHLPQVMCTHWTWQQEDESS